MECATDDDCLAYNAMCVVNVSWAEEIIKQGTLDIGWAFQVGCACDSAFGVLYDESSNGCTASEPLVYLFAALFVLLILVTLLFFTKLLYKVVLMRRLRGEVGHLISAVLSLLVAFSASTTVHVWILLTPKNLIVSMDKIRDPEFYFKTSSRAPPMSSATMHSGASVHLASLFFSQACVLYLWAEICLVVYQTLLTSQEKSSFSQLTRVEKSRLRKLCTIIQTSKPVTLCVCLPAIFFHLYSINRDRFERHRNITMAALAVYSFICIVFFLICYSSGMKKITILVEKTVMSNNANTAVNIRLSKSLAASRLEKKILCAGMLGFAISLIFLSVGFGPPDDGFTKDPRASKLASRHLLMVLIRLSIFTWILAAYNYSGRLMQTAISARQAIYSQNEDAKTSQEMKRLEEISSKRNLQNSGNTQSQPGNMKTGLETCFVDY